MATISLIISISKKVCKLSKFTELEQVIRDQREENRKLLFNSNLLKCMELNGGKKHCDFYYNLCVCIYVNNVCAVCMKI